MVSPTSYGDTAWAPGMTTDIFVPDQLIGGDMKIVTDTRTILAGAAIYKRGTVLGAVTASGKLTPALAASADGSQVPYAILVDDVDVTAGDALGGVYLQGEFNQNAVILGTGITLAGAKAALETRKIYLKAPVSAADPT
ncbi:MAG: head decoration protein [Pseudomonadota bacterium]|nr:head decoration protein [Pseudomonadota bacterium]